MKGPITLDFNCVGVSNNNGYDDRILSSNESGASIGLNVLPGSGRKFFYNNLEVFQKPAAGTATKITGSKSSATANVLGQVITALANLGLVIDQSTA